MSIDFDFVASFPLRAFLPTYFLKKFFTGRQSPAGVHQDIIIGGLLMTDNSPTGNDRRKIIGGQSPTGDDRRKIIGGLLSTDNGC